MKRILFGSVIFQQLEDPLEFELSFFQKVPASGIFRLVEIRPETHVQAHWHADIRDSVVTFSRLYSFSLS